MKNLDSSPLSTKVLVTGAAGFIGSHLCEELDLQGYILRRVLRRPDQSADAVVTEIRPDTDWSGIVDEVDYVIHLAALVHITRPQEAVEQDAYYKSNVDTTLNLAMQAVDAGVKRFVYISSIKVNGESTKHGELFTADSDVHPTDPYGISKWEAEKALFNLAKMSKMEIVCIRPPLVYGPGVKANFHTMMRWVDKGIPLPFARIENQRSLVGIGNLVDLIITCMRHPAAANQTFLASDDHDMSTPELLQCTAQALGGRARLFYLPVYALKLMALLMGKRAMLKRLTDSLQVDITKNQQLLGWSPPYTHEEELSKTAAAYLRELSN